MSNFSSGTFAVVSIMVGKCINKYSNIQQVSSNSTEAALSNEPSIGYSPVEIATLVCFMVGVIQVNHIS